jgi:hypothetical protein
MWTIKVMDNDAIIPSSVYIVLFTLLFGFITFGSVIALRNFNHVIFRSLGREYIILTLVLSLLTHAINVLITLELIFFDNLTLRREINGVILGVRMLIYTSLYSVLLGRQLTLSRIFGVFSNRSKRLLMSKNKIIWLPIIISCICWIPLIALYYPADLGIIPDSPYLAVYLSFQVIYTLVYIYIVYRNRGIDRIYTDYYLNIIATCIFIVIYIIDAFAVIEYQIITLNNFMFQVLVTYSLGILFGSINLLILAKPLFIYYFRPETLSKWQQFGHVKDIDLSSSSSNKSTSTPSIMLSKVTIGELNGN